MAPRGIDDIQRTENIDPRIHFRVLHGNGHRNLRGEMNDIVGAKLLEGALDGFGDIKFIEPRVGRDLVRAAAGEVVQDRDLVSAPKKLLCNMRAYKARTAGNQNLPTHSHAPE